jgi:hypothetical protein
MTRTSPSDLNSHASNVEAKAPGRTPTETINIPASTTAANALFNNYQDGQKINYVIIIPHGTSSENPQSGESHYMGYFLDNV